jgi:hypothetical protein
MRRGIPLALAILFTTAALTDAATPTTTPAAARARVDHHLRHVERLSGHFETLLTAQCPRFPTRSAWDTYVEGETDRLVLLMAHLEQAWVEAKRTDDDDVRRTAKAPRRQSDQMWQLIDKLSACADVNGAAFSPRTVWRRIERDVPRRQTEIALPE